MTVLNQQDSECLKTFGLTAEEISDGHGAAVDLLHSQMVRRAMSTLEVASADTTEAIYDALVAKSFSGAFAEAGKRSAAYFSQRPHLKGQRWFNLLDQVLAAPPTHADTADWWLLFSALNAEIEFQLSGSGAPKTERLLSGKLISDLKHAGRTWGGLLAPLLARRVAALVVHEIDLERLGGEQVTGGDFGLVLDFDGLTAQPSSSQLEGHRIVPLIFQAKRYVRPSADVSQSHPVRGKQRDLLGANACASAYIFYENGDELIAEPLPVLVKPIERVGAERMTSVFDGTVDFATYLYQASTDSAFAPRASSPENALAMMYKAVDRGQLSHLLVISGSRNAGLRYQAAVAHIAANYGADAGEPADDKREDEPDTPGLK